MIFPDKDLISGLYFQDVYKRQGLHVGHPLGYIASDIVARYKRLKGFNVLHPMGYDAFGLPAEQYAIQTGVHPEVSTAENIARYRSQLDNIGFSFDWSREVNTSDPKYYKWTQWIFLQLFASWYDKNSGKAQPISVLISRFEEGGSSVVNACLLYTSQWLRIHEIWHEMGNRSNATMLYGHIESYFHRIDHLDKLRDLQDKTGGFQTFIPLKFRNQDNQMSYLSETTHVEDLRNYAISRIYLDNFDHIKAYWPMIGREMAQLSLSFGVDDIDGTIDDTTKIYSMAGSEEQNPALSTEELVTMIRRVGRKPIERDTLYNVIEDYTDVVFEDDQLYKGYISLPVV